MTPVLQGYIREAERAYQVKAERHRLERARLAEQHRAERRKLDQGQEKRWARETAERAARFPKGSAACGTGSPGATRKSGGRTSMKPTWPGAAIRTQREALIASQLDERQRIQERILEVRRNHARDRNELEQDIAAYMLGRKRDHDLVQKRPERITQG
jgi:hypothetical protein